MNLKPVLLVAEWRLKREQECGHGGGGSGGVGVMATSQPTRSCRWATGAPKCRPLAPKLDKQSQNSKTIPFFWGGVVAGARSRFRARIPVPILGPVSGPPFGFLLGGPDSGPKIGTGIRSRNRDRNLVNFSNFFENPGPGIGSGIGTGIRSRNWGRNRKVLDSGPGIGTGFQYLYFKKGIKNPACVW